MVCFGGNYRKNQPRSKTGTERTEAAKHGGSCSLPLRATGLSLGNTEKKKRSSRRAVRCPRFPPHPRRGIHSLSPPVHVSCWLRTNAPKLFQLASKWTERLLRPDRALSPGAWKSGRVCFQVLSSKDVYDRDSNSGNKTQGTRASMESQDQSLKSVIPGPRHTQPLYDTQHGIYTVCLQQLTFLLSSQMPFWTKHDYRK